MSIEDINSIMQPKIPESSRKELFENIQTPDELLSFMKNKIKYGLIDKADKRIYSPEIDGWGEGDQPEQYLQNPDELLESGYGTCWEQTELAKKWLRENGFESKSILFMFGKNVSQKNPAHSIAVYKKDNKWYWFENSLDGKNGIHDFSSMNELANAVKNKLIANAKDNGATTADINLFKQYEYETSLNDCDSSEDFLFKVKDENRH